MGTARCFRLTIVEDVQLCDFPNKRMSLLHPMHYLTVDELLERAAPVANLAMLRIYAEPSPIQIAMINEYTPLLESELRSLPPNETLTRDRILAQLSIHRSILAPIRRLPVELLSEIFSRVQKITPLRTLQVATVMSHVCFTWRTVARGHGALWTKVVVKTIYDFDRYCERFLPIAGKVPLELRCDDREVLGHLWDRIAPYASRLRRITLIADLSMLPDLKVLYMENLERLVVDAYDTPASAKLSALDFVVAPCLRHVALTLDVLQSERQLHVPVTRALTSLEIDVMTQFPVTLTLPLLRACATTLQSLTIKIRQMSEGVDRSYPTSASATFEMQSLTYLSLVDPACSLLNHIDAPLTQELVLSTVPTYGTQSLLGFLTRSKACRHLRTLRIYDVEERDPSAWIPCLQLMHGLRELHFDDMLSNPQILEQMTQYEDRPPLLPALEGIAIWRVFWAHLELHDAIGEMLSSRDQETTTRNGLRCWKIVRWIDAWPDP
ncbi:uncharacterized protein SCHCODRAFT_01161075 [Schizophyllum commune H4-8]|nr:uncharacterized protein SCHCODRAFT_01161075 [Schizophyllum commune H4-8]KAI5886838.1 hypothetical protein SCHCODRAFT_01161075 [Schizophyllum commune H4-8]